jgi:hypothetical protein
MRVKKLLEFDICNGALNSTAIMLSAALALSGCLKPGMSSTDTIRTGNGDSMRYMVPIAVKQDDGSSAYCVYVARPNSDMSFFENLGPGQTDGATPVTKNAIPQGQFIQNLRDPEIMKDLGGLGNDMVNDLFTAGSAWMLASAGLAAGGAGAAFGRSGEFKDYRKTAEKFTARLLEADSIFAGELKTSYDDLAKLLRKNGASQKAVDQFIRVLTAGSPGGKLNSFYDDFFDRYGTTLGQSQKLSEISNMLRGARGKNVSLSASEAEGFLKAVQSAYSGKSANGLEMIIERITGLEGSSTAMVKGIQRVQGNVMQVGNAARKNNGSLDATLKGAVSELDQLANDFTAGVDAADANNGWFQNRKSVGRLKSLAKDEGIRLGQAAKGASAAARNAAGISRGPLSWFGRPAIAEDDALKRMKNVSTFAVDEAASVGFDSPQAAGGLKNLFANACLRGSNGWVQVTKMAFCGLAVGAGSFGVKKLLFEPATEPIKREQVAQSFEFNETVQEVNDNTFRRLEETIASFKSEPTALSCQ